MTGMSSRMGKLSRSALQIRTRWALLWCSGPLQRGHTRLVSSRASMQLLFQPVKESGIGKLCGHAHRPKTIIVQSATFYGVLVSDQDDLRLCFFKGRALKTEMIRQGQGVRELNARLPQRSKKTLGMADGRRREDL